MQTNVEPFTLNDFFIWPSEQFRQKRMGDPPFQGTFTAFARDICWLDRSPSTLQNIPEALLQVGAPARF